jgi:uncharacterized glyoxalase superfamily protein PhnB
MTDPLTSLTPPAPNDGPTPEFARRLRSRIEAIEERTMTRHDVTRDPATNATAGHTSGDGGWHLAQLNLGVFKAPLDSPEMQPFAAALDRINTLADTAPGFVWRLTSDDGAPSSFVEVPGADDPLLASNLSVWSDLESLRNFMYRTDHAAYLRRRREWFVHERRPMTVAWWIRAGTIPTLEDAMRRLEHLREHGPSDVGFPLGRTVPPPPSTTADDRPRQVLIPYLTVGDARAALLFYAEVFGAEQSGELFEMDDGRIGHAEMAIDGQEFYLADAFAEMNLRAPSEVGANSVSIVINVDDCDRVFDHALLAGATQERPPTDQHGRRSGWFVDPWGHRWCPTSPLPTTPSATATLH